MPRQPTEKPTTRASTTPAKRAATKPVAKHISATPHEPKLASVAALVADPTRSRMLCYLLSGEYASAGELATAASITAATASGHLAKLLNADLVRCEQRGRHRYYRLADADVAHALETLALVAERQTHAQAWSSPARARLRSARCCYGHLAGQLGVDLFQQMSLRQWLVSDAQGRLGLTATGQSGLNTLGMDGAHWAGQFAAPSSTRLAYPCLDWSERRDHLAGKLAAALLTHCIDQGWLRKVAGERALNVTPSGRKNLAWLLPNLQNF